MPIGVRRSMGSLLFLCQTASLGRSTELWRLMLALCEATSIMRNTGGCICIDFEFHAVDRGKTPGEMGYILELGH